MHALVDERRSEDDFFTSVVSECMELTAMETPLNPNHQMERSRKDASHSVESLNVKSTMSWLLSVAIGVFLLQGLNMHELRKFWHIGTRWAPFYVEL